MSGPEVRKRRSSFIDPKTIGQPAPRPRRHKRSATGYRAETDATGEEVWPRGDPKVWKAGIRTGLETDASQISSNIVHHVQTSLARQAYNLDNAGAYQAVALTTRDDLIVNWNDTQMFLTNKAPKRAYYLSLEWLMGRALDNALLNLGVKDKFRTSVDQLGFNLEDLIDEERDAGLGNGGLGRLAACYIDSTASQELPVWGYGLRYHYGIFQQLIGPDGSQLEAPDPWLEHANAWELPRLDVTYEIRFYGHAERIGNNRAVWSGGQEVVAVAYDVPIPGYETRNTNNIRLFNAGDYERALEASNSASQITAVLYPNDNHWLGKELRLKQQYFWTAASLADIVRRFKYLDKPWTEFPDSVAIQLNDTHPTLAIPELMRILVDEEEVEWAEAWNIVRRTFAYTNHTALEKWPVPLIQNLLPRHLQIIYDINLNFLQAVERTFPKEHEKLSRMSLIQEGNPQHVRMANLAVIGSHTVNGVAELHSELVRTTILKDFVDFFGRDKFRNVTNGITPRRWLDQCNPRLSSLIEKKLGSKAFLKDLTLLEGLLKYVDDPKFQKEWQEVKHANKERLANYIRTTTGSEVNTDAMFDVQVKRIHEYKRQTLNILGVIHRWTKIKAMTLAERKKVNPRVVLFAGKAAPGYYMAKLTIRLIVNVSKIINADPDTKEYLTVHFLPDYS
ncbi:carbohydrate phosphorylase-domain-containing protein, partial [Auriculariales sp. MPI-PUGE-AT-0066]